MVGFQGRDGSCLFLWVDEVEMFSYGQCHTLIRSNNQVFGCRVLIRFVACAVAQLHQAPHRALELGCKLP